MDLNDARPLAKSHTFGSVPGYVHAHRGEDWIYLTADQLKAIIGTGKAAGRLKARLVEDGLAYGYELGSPPDWDKDASEKIAHFEAISRQAHKGLWPDWLGEKPKN